MTSSTRSRLAALTAAAAAAALLGGCAARPELPAELGRRELVDVPFFPQSDYDCGPAALATVLAHSGVPVTAEALIDAVYVEALRGSLQAELSAAARRHGRLPYPIEPEPRALLAEVAAGRPVLVLQNLGLPRVPIWHYAVVVGFDALDGRVVLRSGAEKRRVVSARRFFNSWRRAERWGLVVVEPDDVPATAAPERFVRTVVDAERLLPGDAVAAAHAAALARWPDDDTVLFAAAAHAQAVSRLEEAETLYGRLLARRGRHAAARNNLAHVLLERGCAAEALAEARAALAHADPADPLYAAISDSVREIGAAVRASGGAPGPGDRACP